MIKRKTYWKDLIQSFTGSKGRFLSILTLMMLGSLALVGLKVTSPNMEATANAYLRTAQTLDLAVMSNYGLDQTDQEELEQIEGAEVEFLQLCNRSLHLTTFFEIEREPRLGCCQEMLC